MIIANILSLLYILRFIIKIIILKFIIMHTDVLVKSYSNLEFMYKSI